VSTTSPHTASHHAIPLHVRMERALGADMRLLYGIAAPIAAAVAFIIALALSKQTWMAGVVVFFLVIALAVVVFGIYEMLGEDEEDKDTLA
jgi:cell shape-determining protein MreD